MLLPNEKYLSLRTFRKIGTGVDTPVWFASDSDKKLYIFSAGNAGKIKRLRNSSKAEVTRCDFKGGSLGKWLICQAFLVEDPAEAERAHGLLVSKYGWRMLLIDILSKITGRFPRRIYIRIELRNLTSINIDN